MMAHSVLCGPLITALSLASLAYYSNASSFLRSGQVTEEDAASVLSSELIPSANNQRLAALEERLRSTYKSLPKNSAGNLGHQAVRYVLHRLFVRQHGWFIRGLEPNNNTWTSRAEPAALKEWVPSYLQSLLEKRLGERGTSLHELAALAAALEDLVRREAAGRLKTAYEIHGLPLDGDAPEEKVEEVVTTYYMMYLLAGNFTVKNLEDLETKKSIFFKKYSGWKEAKAWLDGILNRHISPARKSVLDLKAVAGVVNDIGEQYYTFNDLECRSLKATLNGMEGKKAGRIRLSAFYKAGLYSHWRFNEKVEYLRSLGVLDETDPDVPLVILPNYVMARTNCLEASHLYAVCCRNECEDLIGHLEREIGSGTAEPERIAALVGHLPSDTVSAPRNVSEALARRLRDVAHRHGGRVPLHGRLFAQWMHHAYPRECPYPHEVGRTNPQTPDEWIKETGHAESEASKQEMLRHVESDTCASDAAHEGGGCGEEDDELPWSEAEELLLVERAAAEGGGRGVRPATSWFARICLAVTVSASLVAFLAADRWRELRRRGSKEGLLFAGKWASTDGLMVLPLSVAALAALLLGLLDGTTVACAFCLGLASLSLRRLPLWQKHWKAGCSSPSKLPL